MNLRGRAVKRKRGLPRSRAEREIRLRVAFSAAFFAIALAILALAWWCHPATDVSLLARVPSAGATTELSGLAPAGTPRTSPAPLEAHLRTFSVEELGGPPDADGGGDFLIELGVARGECRRLEIHLGGGCGDRGAGAPRRADIFTIESDPRSLPLTMEVWPEDADSLALSQFGGPAGQTLPMDWSLKVAAPLTRVSFRCSEATRVTISGLLPEAQPLCVPREATFHLRLPHRKPYLQSVFLNDLSEIDLAGRSKSVLTAIDRGRLDQGGSKSWHQGGAGEPILVSAVDSRLVEAELHESVVDSSATFTVTAPKAMVSLDDETATPSWLNQHSELIYLLLGTAAGLLAGALIDSFIVRRR